MADHGSEVDDSVDFDRLDTDEPMALLMVHFSDVGTFAAAALSLIQSCGRCGAVLIVLLYHFQG